MSGPKNLRQIGSILGNGARPGLPHPTGSGFGMPIDERVRKMAPDRIIMEGPYVRVWIEDEGFSRFVEALKENGDIGQPIGIRTAGPPTNRRFILVYGMRRWKGALKAGLKEIPVRNYGDISEEESLALQVMENDLRDDPHPVDRAHGYYQLVRLGWSQARIVKAMGKDKGYVSFMTKAGEAIALLTEEERLLLYSAPDVTVRAFQELATIKDAEERKVQLLALAQGKAPAIAAAAKKQAPPPPAFKPRQHRDGRSFRMRWTEEDLKTRGADFLEEYATHVAKEHDHMIARLRQLEKDGVIDPSVTKDAVERVKRVLRDRLGL